MDRPAQGDGVRGAVGHHDELRQIDVRLGDPFHHGEVHDAALADHDDGGGSRHRDQLDRVVRTTGPADDARIDTARGERAGHGVGHQRAGLARCHEHEDHGPTRARVARGPGFLPSISPKACRTSS